MEDMISEALFWKLLADILLENDGINKKAFYKKIEPVKSVWHNTKDIDEMPEDARKIVRRKTQYIRRNFVKIISELKNDRQE